MAERLFNQVPAIAKKLDEARSWIVAIDFDGTLAPIVENPSDAALEPRLLPLLSSLAARTNLSTVIVSGRQLADVETRVGLPGVIYAGSHGLDIDCRSQRFQEPNAVANQSAVDSLAELMSNRLADIPGILVENKRLTLSVHYRRVDAKAHEEVRTRVHGVLSDSNHPFVLSMGKRVFEIKPRTSWNKGKAISWIQERIRPEGKILYVGDDRTDEDAFLACTDGISVSVGRPEETMADYFLDSQEDVFSFLEWLLTRV